MYHAFHNYSFQFYMKALIIIIILFLSISFVHLLKYAFVNQSLRNVINSTMRRRLNNEILMSISLGSFF